MVNLRGKKRRRGYFTTKALEQAIAQKIPLSKLVSGYVKSREYKQGSRYASVASAREKKFLSDYRYYDSGGILYTVLVQHGRRYIIDVRWTRKPRKKRRA